MNQPLQNKSLPMPSLRNIQAFIEVADTGSLNLAKKRSKDNWCEGGDLNPHVRKNTNT